MIILSVVYPKTPQAHFDLDYYMSKHMPMVRSHWSAMGLQKDEILHGIAAVGGGAPAYEITALLTFTSQQHFEEALAAAGKEILADVPNFTNIQPTLQINEVAA